MSTVTRPVAGSRREGATSWWALAGFILVAELAGIIGLPFTETDPGSWYSQIDKPGFTPPGAVFGPVWTVLYALIGVAAWMVWRQPASVRRSRALLAYAVQLALNAAWTPVFFGGQAPAAGLAVVLALLAAVVTTLVLFIRVDRLAGVVFAPYLAWITFATALNAAIAMMN
jgi:translocator protein